MKMEQTNKIPVAHLTLKNDANKEITSLQVELIYNHVISLGYDEETAKNASERDFKIDWVSSLDKTRVRLITFTWRFNSDYETLRIDIDRPKNNPYWMYEILSEKVEFNQS